MEQAGANFASDYADRDSWDKWGAKGHEKPESKEMMLAHQAGSYAPEAVCIKLCTSSNALEVVRRKLCE